MNFISPEDFLAPVYEHLKLYMEKERWTKDVRITEIADRLVVVNDRSTGEMHNSKTPPLVIAYFEPSYHQPLEALPVLILPSGVIMWQSNTNNMSDVIAYIERDMNHTSHAPLLKPNRFFGSLIDLEMHLGK